MWSGLSVLGFLPLGAGFGPVGGSSGSVRPVLGVGAQTPVPAATVLGAGVLGLDHLVCHVQQAMPE